MSKAAHTREELVIERDWLRKRVRDLGCIDFGKPATGGRAVNAMVEYVLGGGFPSEDAFPKNEDDLTSCRTIRDTAPSHLQEAMDEVIAQYEKQPLTPSIKLNVGGIAIKDFISSLENDVFTVGPEVIPSGHYTSDDPLLAEHQFLRERARLCGGFLTADGAKRCWGTSSNALVEYVLGGSEPLPSEHPHDGSDLAACEAVVAVLPPHLQERGIAQLERFYSITPDGMEL